VTRACGNVRKLPRGKREGEGSDEERYAISSLRTKSIRYREGSSLAPIEFPAGVESPNKLPLFRVADFSAELLADDQLMFSLSLSHRDVLEFGSRANTDGARIGSSTMESR